MISKLNNWLDRRSLRRRKRRQLVEVTADINFVEKFRGHLLKFDEVAARKKLVDEKSKANQSQEVIETLSTQIAKARSAKAEIEQLRKIQSELPIYIKSI